MHPEIYISFVYPPIPIRTMDWAACMADLEGEHGGLGATPREAVEDMCDNLESARDIAESRGNAFYAEWLNSLLREAEKFALSFE